MIVLLQPMNSHNYLEQGKIVINFNIAMCMHNYVAGLHTLLSRSVIENGHISLSARLRVFTIVGTAGNAHAVRLFPKESCTCPSTGLCYHIMAAKLSIGMNVLQNPPRVNLTQLYGETQGLRTIKHLAGKSLG